MEMMIDHMIKRKRSKKDATLNRPIFYDAEHKRLYLLCVCATAVFLLWLFFKIFYPDYLTLLRYSVYPYRLLSVHYINRIFSWLIGIDFVKLFAWVLLSRKSKTLPQKSADAKVTAVIPAYNEEKVILSTVACVLASDYKNIEVIVVDDGSADRTSLVVTEAYGNDPRIKLITKQNAGKAQALNTGIAASSGEILILIDADTRIAPDAISLLVPHFKNSRVAAVSGNTRVGNAHNFITRCQHLEYIRDFNLIKNGMSKLNCMAVVPGALGAWRKKAVLDCGGFSAVTLGEDRDLTMALMKSGYRLVFEAKAFALTEAPDTFKDFIKQRFRWTYSTLQCVRKYHSSFLNPKRPALGFILMPDLVISQIFVPTVTAVTFILNLFAYSAAEFGFLLIVAGLTLLLDMILFIVSTRITKEKIRVSDVLLIIPQIITYGILCTFILFKSLIKAFSGGKVGWNKVRRTGDSQTAPFSK